MGGPVDEEFRESGPAPGAERMFADDPEMLAMIKKAREREGEPGPRRKPWWWQGILVVAGLSGAAAVTAPALAGLVPFHPLLPASGLFGGMVLALAALGHRPGYYEITDGQSMEGEKATLWKPMPALHRALALLIALAAPAVGVGLVLMQ
jgi:hypothetical protein